MSLCNAATLRVPEQNRQIVRPTDDLRRRALVRLYERRFAVDNLIRALERYQQDQSGLPAKRASLSAVGTSL